MAYYSGTASSLTDLRTALLTHAAADGWAVTGVTSFTGTITGASNRLTVSAISVGSIAIGELITGPGVPADTRVLSFATGTGGVGTYIVSAAVDSLPDTAMTQPGKVMSKAGVFFRVGQTGVYSIDTNITCLGCESNAVANPASGVVQVGRVYFASGKPTREISFPCNYEVFGFAQELYLVANYDVDAYQWMAFGKSAVPGLPGQAGWCAATIGNVIPSLIVSGSYTTGPVYLSMTNIDTLNPVISGQLSSCALAGNISTTVFAAALNVFVNHNLDSHGWKQGPSGAANMLPIGMQSIRELIWQQPSTWNTESTLMPIRFYKERPSFKASMILDCENARHLRIDNLMPGDILIIGSDKWKVFPWYRKDSAARNGTASISSDGNLSQNHTGTFGWAIRYEGP